MSHVELFDQYRPLLFSIAYRILGSAMDAEDLLQEAFLRWQEVELKGNRLGQSVSDHYRHAVEHRPFTSRTRAARKLYWPVAARAIGYK